MQDELHSDEAEKEKMHGNMRPILETMKEKVEPEAFCEYLRDRAGLIADYGKESYIFRHKSFREYLAGRELVTKAERDTECFEQIVSRFGQDWWNEPLRFFMGEVDDTLFDQFMEALFKSEASQELDQKSYNLLLTMVSEAPQRRIDALVERLNDEDSTGNQRRYIVDCLKTIGGDDAFKAIKAFGDKQTETDAGSFARDVAVEAASGVLSVHDVKIKITDKSFRNRTEYNAEYILIPAGRYKYQGKAETDVPSIYFAKYPVTNKRFRRFIRYLRLEKSYLSEILPKGEFDRRMKTLFPKIEGLGKYMGGNPDGWAETLRSEYDTEKRYDGEDQPVVGVSWFGARAYCCWLSLLEAAHADLETKELANLYRLPTEREWEWAASGGKRAYPWGDKEPNDKLANYNQHVGATTPVGRYPEGSTPEGLMDMAGNVWEWMENRYSITREARSLRGGSWLYGEDPLRCSSRDWVVPVLRDLYVGFRVVRSQS
jgi:formylglycine-generating enzyme required for sulfatase activity